MVLQSFRQVLLDQPAMLLDLYAEACIRLINAGLPAVREILNFVLGVIDQTARSL
jgi:hypothetical protein